MRRTLLVSVLLGATSPAVAHEVEQLAIGTDQTEVGIADNHVVMYGVGASGDGQTVLYDYLNGTTRTIARLSRDTQVNLRGDVVFSSLHLYRYEPDTLIQIPSDSLGVRPAINLPGTVLWSGVVDGASGLYLYDADAEATARLGDASSSFAIGDNGDVARTGPHPEGWGSDVLFYDATTGETRPLVNAPGVSPLVWDVNGHGDVLWFEQVSDTLYVYEKAAGEHRAISLIPGSIGKARLSDSGDVVWEGSSAVGIYRYERASGAVFQLTGERYHRDPQINARGDITWYGGPAGWDIFFYDRSTDLVERLTDDGAAGGMLHYYPKINSHGDVAWIMHDYDYGARVFLATAGLPASVDIKPGTDENCFTNDGRGAIPVAILGDDVIDVREIDPASVRLESLSVRVVGKNKLLYQYEDVDGDGLEDLVVQIEDEDGVFDLGNGMATVRARLTDGTLISGADDICVVGGSTVIWGVSAIASSEYTATAWSAERACGAPDTVLCADAATAWAPRPWGADPEWIEVDFGRVAQAIGLKIHETFESGFVTQIELIDGNGVSTSVWSGVDTTGCPGWFEVEWGTPPRPVRSVRIHTQVDGWEEIDAVGLITSG